MPQRDGTEHGESDVIGQHKYPPGSAVETVTLADGNVLIVVRRARGPRKPVDGQASDKTYCR